MSNYSKTTDFEAKDSLPTGDSGKIIRGSEFETEFDAISAAIATKADTAGPTFTGTLTFETISDGTINVTAFVDEDNMASNSATLIPTQQSVKAYVDSQITANNELSEVLSNGNTTGGSNISFGDNDKAVFGAGNDLQIFHDGSGSFISDTGTGDLHIRASNTLRLQNSAGQLYAFGFNGGEFALYHNNAQKLATTSTGIDVTGVITTDGLTTTGNINFMDNDKAIFGGSSDLQIYHSGTESRIDESGPGNLKINADNLEFYNSASTEAKAKFNTNGSVQLYHDNAQKLVTTSTGIDVTGAVTADSLSNLIFVDSANNHVGINTNSPASLLHVYHATDDTILKIESGDGQSRIDLIDSGGTARLNSVGSDLRLEADPTNSVSNSTIDFKVDGTEAMRISAGGDISFFEDTGTTAKFFFDASAEALILGGNFSSSDKFEIRASSGQESGIRLANNASSDFRIFNNGSNALQFNIGTSTEAMRIDSSGKVGIGTSSPTRLLHVRDASSQTVAIFDGGANSAGEIGFRANGTSGDTYVTIGAVANDMVLSAGANERMRIDSSGDVIIGTQSQGGDRILSLRGNSAVLGYDSSATAAVIQSGNVKDLKFCTGTDTFGANERMRIDSSGNVGIGTSSPANQLDIVSTSNATARIEGGANGDASLKLTESGNSGVQLKYDGTNNLLVIGGGTSGSFTTHMALTRDGGNLLVGKTSTDTMNTVGAEVQADGQIKLAADGKYPLQLNRLNSDGEILNLRKDGTTVGGIGSFASDITLGKAACGLRFEDGTQTIRPHSLTTNSSNDGNVTLGNTDARFKDLHVSNSVKNASGGLAVESGGGNQLLLKASSELIFTANASERARINTSGDFLVGTTSDGGIGHTLKPSGQLRMKGSGTTGFQIVQFSNDNGQVGNITTSGTGTTYNTSSDQRLKDNIVDAPSASDDIDAIQVRSFDWKADGSHQKYGMVAQELQSVAPEAVSQGETEEDMMGVDYSKLVPMMMKEIQSLRARVAQLEGVN